MSHCLVLLLECYLAGPFPFSLAGRYSCTTKVWPMTCNWERHVVFHKEYLQNLSFLQAFIHPTAWIEVITGALAALLEHGDKTCQRVDLEGV